MTNIRHYFQLLFDANQSKQSKIDYIIKTIKLVIFSIEINIQNF